LAHLGQFIRVFVPSLEIGDWEPEPSAPPP